MRSVGGDLVGGLGAAIVLGAGIAWFQRMRQVRIPANRSLFQLAFGLGALLGLVALVRGTGLAGGAAAILALVAGAGFLGLQLLSGQERREPAVAVGGPILDFQAPHAAGGRFDLATLRGRPFLLKFFRGHW